MNKEGAITGIIVGLSFTFGYIVYFTFLGGVPEDYLFGISPTGIGTLGTLLHLIVAYTVSRMTPPPPEYIQELVEKIRIPSGANASIEY
jgi:cation/acetate symporter